MFNKLFSRDLPAAKAYHAAKLSARGNDQFASSVLEYTPRKTADELNAAIDRYVAAINAQRAPVSGKMTPATR